MYKGVSTITDLDPRTASTMCTPTSARLLPFTRISHSSLLIGHSLPLCQGLSADGRHVRYNVTSLDLDSRLSRQLEYPTYHISDGLPRQVVLFLSKEQPNNNHSCMHSTMTDLIIPLHHRERVMLSQ